MLPRTGFTVHIPKIKEDITFQTMIHCDMRSSARGISAFHIHVTNVHKFQDGPTTGSSTGHPSAHSELLGFQCGPDGGKDHTPQTTLHFPPEQKLLSLNYYTTTTGDNNMSEGPIQQKTRHIPFTRSYIHDKETVIRESADSNTKGIRYVSPQDIYCKIPLIKTFFNRKVTQNYTPTQ